MADRRLSGGDAMVVIVLIMFIFGWVAGWYFALDAWFAEEEVDLDGWDAATILAFVALPAMWAGDRIRHITDRPQTEQSDESAPDA